MSIKKHLKIRSHVLKDSVNKYAILGLCISLVSIFVASILVSYQLTGFINFDGILLAHKTNPALWALDLTPFMFAYWGQSFCYELASNMEDLIEDKTRELANKSSDLELKLHYETMHDHLTNLANQRLLVERINQAINQVKKNEEVALIFLHINGFREINFEYGSFNGNSLLIQFSEKLKNILLEPFLLQAYMGMNMVARLQGAEFAILLPRLNKNHDLEKIIEQLLELTSVNFMIDGNNVKISTGAGVSLYPTDADNGQTLLKNASASLFYADKNKKPYAIYSAGMSKHVKNNGLKTKELMTEFDNGGFMVIYEPMVDLKTGKIVGVEVFPHFNDPEFSKLGIEDLSAMLEGSVMPRKVTHLMLKQGIEQLSLWQKDKHQVVMSFNIFDATDEELPAYIHSLLKEYSIDPVFLRIALTEKACLSDQRHTIDILNQLAELGIKVVISDFCSGYSSFTYLTSFPISEIKIDKSHIMNMMHNEKKQQLVSSIIKLAETMGLVVYADGIIDEPMMNKLKKLGCLYGQGNHFSPPVPAEKMTSML